MAFARNPVSLLQQNADVSLHQMDPASVVMYRDRDRKENEGRIEIPCLVNWRLHFIRHGCRQLHVIAGTSQTRKLHGAYVSKFAGPQRVCGVVISVYPATGAVSVIE